MSSRTKLLFIKASMYRSLSGRAVASEFQPGYEEAIPTSNDRWRARAEKTSSMQTDDFENVPCDEQHRKTAKQAIGRN